ncbi:MAG: 50S ribosomal protein L11 methyltransferase [Proteobacteria bacterium]|nr:50S ribosomal protein L11 methyltransferase [Pseudomonadota bacterium]
MPWQAVTLETDRGDTDAFCDALLEAGALSVTLEDADAGTQAEEARFDEPAPGARQARRVSEEDGPLGWTRNRVHILLEQTTDAGPLLAGAASSAGWPGVPAFVSTPVADDDWVRRTQAQFAPQRIGERLWIVPSWHAVPTDPGAVVVRLDPGAAFGTGAHPTTRMVLAWLERTLAPRAAHMRVLDYGCGSGILAIAAARLGATQVDAIDLDPLALEAARANATNNNVALGVFDADAQLPGDYDVVVANILARPLIVLAPAISARVGPGGRLALSGVLATQADEVMAAYAQAFTMAVAGAEEDWVLLEGRRLPVPHAGTA